MEKTQATGAVMVVGGGIGGMQAAIDLAESGFKVYLVEEKSAIGGNMARLDKTFPTNDCAMCIMSPKLVETGRHLDIEIITGGTVTALDGEPGSFRAHVRQEPRFVDINDCTGCGDCRDACPVSIENPFEAGLGDRKAIDRLYPQATPAAYDVLKLGRPPCRETCPSGVNVQGYVALIAEGRFSDALEVVKRKLPFPGILGRICHHPCEEQCNRSEIDGQPVSICRLKRAADDHADPEQLPPEPPVLVRDQKVAVIGGGPAGLTAALDLCRDGYPVTVFDANDRPGGTMRHAIPAYRLPEEVLARETETMFEAHPHLEWRGGVRLGTDFTLDDLSRQGYGSVVLALGVVDSRPLDIPGAEAPGVLPGMDFLRSARTGESPELPGRVVVIGGGNVAVDCARSAFRAGASEVSLVCLEAENEMPAHHWEVDEARAEGVAVHNSWGPGEFLVEDGRVKGVALTRCVSVFDEQGRFSPTMDPDTTQTLEADAVIVAIGQRADLSGLSGSGVSANDRGLVPSDPVTLGTSRDGVFAAGDVVSGPASVVEAVASGHRAAESVRRFLTGEDLSAGRHEPQLASLGVPEGTHPHPSGRHEPPHNLKLRPRDHGEVVGGFDRDQAIEEAKRCLDCGLCSECLACVEACQREAINHDMEVRDLTLDVGAVILTPGASAADASRLVEYGYGRYPNVMTSIEFERMLSASGPYSGEVVRLSDNEHPARIAFIQCAGSRDPERGLSYCSSVCCMYTAKEAIMAMDHLPGVQTTVFYMDIRAYGKEFEQYYENALAQGVNYVRSMVSTIKEIPGTKQLKIRHITEDGQRQEDVFDMVVLAVGLEPGTSAREMASRMGVDVDQHGFCQTSYFAPTSTSRPGVLVAGAFSGPRDIPETVIDASGAASEAGRLISQSRGSLIQERIYPEERDISDEEARVGVFVCNCGRNIGGVVRVPEVVEHASGLSNVVVSQEFLYTCSQDAIEQIQELVAEHGLNRVVVASCTPRTHEPLFQDTIREAGLNPHLFEMANIRDQCSWVHSREPDRATEKAKVLTSMAVAKARLLEPAHRTYFDVDKRCLILGGGAAGLSAALSVADQGFEAYVIEKEEELGGHLRHVHYTLDGTEVGPFLDDLVDRARNHPRVRIYSPAEVVKVSGHVGNFTAAIHLQTEDRTIELRQGAIIVATGAQEAKIEEYGFGEDPRVITASQLEEKIAGGEAGDGSYVFIQCAGSREPDRPYCSRICCSQAVKNALRIKEKDPGARVYVLFREMRAYGFKEEYYREARDKGVVFIRYDVDRKPRVSGGQVAVWDPELGEDLVVDADWIVVAPGMDPGADTASLAQMLKVPLSATGFFLEAHMKLRPVDFATEGIFLCGLAHAPKMLDEALSQANAAAVRAVSILSRDHLESHSLVATVREKWCAGCGLCVTACPYDARVIDEETKVADVIAVLCQGCGACATACPNSATSVKGYSKKQLMSMLEAALD